MNKQIEELYNKLDAQDKIINTQTLEIARLNNLKTATDEAQEIIIELQQRIEELEQLGLTENGIATMYKERIDKAIEYIKCGIKGDINDDRAYIDENALLDILGDKENE